MAASCERSHWAVDGAVPVLVVCCVAIAWKVGMSFWGFLFGAALVVLCFLTLRVPAPHLNSRKVIFLGPGGGHVAYTMGFVDGLLDDIEIKNAMVAKCAVFGGVSSGAQAAAYAMGALHGVNDMHYWYENYVRDGYKSVGEEGTTVMHGKMESAGRQYFHACSEKLGGNIPWLNYFVMSFTAVGTFSPRFLTHFASREAFASAIAATSYVPAIMGLKPWGMLVDGWPVFDGYLGLLRVAFPDNYLIVSFLPHLPKCILRNKNYLSVGDYDTTPESFFVKTFPWGDTAWADAAFKRGREDAIRNRRELRLTLLEFLM